METWIDKIDTDIIPFVKFDGWENRYPAHSSVALSNQEFRELRDAAQNLFRIFNETANVAKNCDSKFRDGMDIPSPLWASIQNPNWEHVNPQLPALASNIARFDFVQAEDGTFHMVELNADTPCAIPEAFYGNKVYCEYRGAPDPNATCYGDLVTMFKKIFVANASRIGDNIICFSCFHDYVEDLGNTKFLMREAQKAIDELHYNNKVVFESFYDLCLDDDGVLTKDLQRVGFLYRLHPLELLVDEVEDGTGYRIGEELLRYARDGKVVMMNPITSILIQNKGYQAFLWSLIDTDALNENDCKILKKYLIPSSFDESVFLNSHQPYVRKPIWGREGNNISTFNERGEIISSKKNEEEDANPERDSRTYLYQKFVPSKRYTVNTDEGWLEGFVTFSVFVLNGVPSACFSRFSTETIAGVEAFWTPLSVLPVGSSSWELSVGS